MLFYFFIALRTTTDAALEVDRFRKFQVMEVRFEKLAACRVGN